MILFKHQNTRILEYIFIFYFGWLRYKIHMSDFLLKYFFLNALYYKVTFYLILRQTKPQNIKLSKRKAYFGLLKKIFQNRILRRILHYFTKQTFDVIAISFETLKISSFTKNNLQIKAFLRNLRECLVRFVTLHVVRYTTNKFFHKFFVL